MNDLKTLKTVLDTLDTLGDVSPSVKFEFNMFNDSIKLNYDSDRDYKFLMTPLNLENEVILEFNGNACGKAFSTFEELSAAFDYYLIRNYIRNSMNYFPKNNSWKYNNLYLMSQPDSYKLLDITDVYNEIKEMPSEDDKLKVIKNKLAKYVGCTCMAIPEKKVEILEKDMATKEFSG
jgi:hypothetical protein